MSLLTDLVPSWISIIFLVVIPIPVFLIAHLAKKGSEDSTRNRNKFAVLIFYAFYFAYVAFACFKGWFNEVSLPPIILKYTMIPLLIFLMLVVFNLPAYRNILRKISLADLVSIHLFRLIGSFFLILGLFKVLPMSIALLAGCGDIITALSSIFVANALKNKKDFAKKLTWVWNTFGFLDIVATSATAFILTKLSIETGSMGVDALGVFPFCFIPAFAPATIIFLHMSIYRKLLMK